LWIVAIGAVLLQNLLRLARWLAGRRRSDGGEYESLSVNWLDAWRGLLRRLIYLLITPFRLAWGLLRARRQGLGEREAAVRRIYTRFLLWAAARGVRRAPSQTPHEFLNELSPRLPGHLAELEALTHGYALVRYGPPGDHGPLVRDLSRALGRLKKARLSKKIEGKS
jgi:hypothetical protein